MAKLVMMNSGRLSYCQLQYSDFESSENLNYSFLAARETQYFVIATIAKVCYQIACINLYLMKFVFCANVMFVTVATVVPMLQEPSSMLQKKFTGQRFALWIPEANLQIASLLL